MLPDNVGSEFDECPKAKITIIDILIFVVILFCLFIFPQFVMGW